MQPIVHIRELGFEDFEKPLEEFLEGINPFLIIWIAILAF